ncbi:hypothetical protein ASD50_20595 [Mesorhizobium sp. Root552]|nr:hypothetical protein ASD50_20595 [Mesorhizobium sp. Root552]
MAWGMANSELRFEINLLSDLTVVTKDGEYLGTWDTDESDAFYEFTPDGATEPLICDVFMGYFCKAIANWHARSADVP